MSEEALCCVKEQQEIVATSTSERIKPCPAIPHMRREGVGEIASLEDERQAMRAGAMLGPQRLVPTISEVLDTLEVGTPIAVVTAGWQERETEDEELREACHGRDLVNLKLYGRWEQVLADDPAFASAHRARQDRLRQQQSLYRIRLDHGMRAARKLLEQDAPQSLLRAEVESAIESIQALDRHHLARLAEIHEAFDAQMRPDERPEIAKHQEELRDLLRDSSALLVAGGHVAVLLNRLRLFKPLSAIGEDLPVIAWSAGAMVLAERVVLFHDSPPQGFGHAEVLDVGFGIFSGILPLPHAKRRLQLKDSERVSLFARRFAPLDCLTLDERGHLRIRPDGSRFASAHVRQLHVDGRVQGL